MMKRLLAFAAGFALATIGEAALKIGTAQAQTYNPHTRNIGYMHPSVAPIWSGFYLGGHLGGGWGSVGVSDISGSLDMNGFVGGVHGGYNLQRGNTLFGLEADVSATGAEFGLQENTASFNLSMPWLASVRARFGLVHDSWLLFVTGGVAFGELKASLRDTDPLFPLDLAMTTKGTGYVVGGGIEKQFSQRFSGRGEVLHYGFGNFGRIDSNKLEADMTVVRAGLTMHMN